MLDFPRGTKVRSGFLHRRRRLAKRRRLRRQLWLEPLEDRRLLSGGPDLVLGQVLPLGAYPTTAVMADLNGDGRAELLAGSTDFSSQHAVSVYQCVPSGQLQLSATLVPPASPGALASGDFNHDDRADIVVGSYSTGTVSVFLQQSDGSFGPPTTYSATRDIETVAVADVNGDGQPDLVVGGADHITILAGRADGTFWPANASGIPGGFMGTFVLGDLNDDGLPDLVAENPAAMTLGVLLGQGDGTFREQSAIYSAGSLLAIGDVTGDGRPDLVASGSEVGGEQLLVAVGQAGGRFSDFRGQGFLQGFAGAGLADFNRDGRAEIVARTLAVRSLDSAAQRSSHNIDNTLTILGFQSDGTFVSQGVYHLGDQSTPYGGPPALGDLNGDGLPEVAVTNMEARGLLLLDRGRPSQPPGARVVQSVGNSGTSGPLELSGSRQRFVFDRAMSPTPPPVIPLLRLSPPPSLAVGEAAGEAPADYFQWHSEWIDANTLDVYCDVLPGAPLGNYDWEITLGPDLLDAAGAPLNQDGDAVPGEATEDGYTVTARVTVAGPRVRFQTPSVWDGLARPIDALTLSFDFNMDPATFSLDDITSFTGPNGAIVDYDYAWTSPSELRLSFPPQTAFGSYQLILSPEIQDFQGRRLDQNRNKLPGEVPGDQYTAAFTLRPPRLSSGWVFPAWNTIWPVSTAEITFDRPIDPASFSLADDLQLTGPEGSLAVSAFRWNGARLQVWFPPQTGAGTYTLTCGPHLADLAGDELDLDGDGIMGETPDDQALAPFTIFADKPYVTAQSPSGVTAGPVSALHMSFDQAMDQTSFAPADDLVSFAGPAGEVSVTGFRWVNERRLELQFAPQSTPGDYHLVLGTSILSWKGRALDTDRDHISGESHDQYTGSFTIPPAPRVT
ncbi:MAG: VCBS repeat-containing protein, partial [Planctomycetota bacterium]|nr:VCBS repeat-containing protein [Planctomycetota bacterium]